MLCPYKMGETLMKTKRIFTILLLVALLGSGCLMTRNRPGGGAVHQTGKASWYGAAFQGKPTASGEPFNMNALTAAHRNLPFGTQVRVTNQNNGRSVVVRINDRGPFVDGRIIDLSRAAAGQIGMIDAGVVPVTLEILN